MLGIRIADINIRIHNRFSNVVTLCRDYLIDLSSHFDLEILVTDEEIDEEIRNTNHEVSRGYAESICAYRNICKQLPSKFNAFLFHAAVIDYRGEGYAFAAQSGTGKSTHISLWKKSFGDEVKVVNGDKPIIRMKNDTLLAYGTPWCGKEGFGCNTNVPLKAICFLERGKENRIERISAGDAVTRIFSQILTPEDLETVDHLFPLLDLTLRLIPCYLLHCNMDVEAALIACNGMNSL